MMESWSTVMLEGLLEARAGGEAGFGRAWRFATRRAAARGVGRPRDFVGPAPVDDPEWLPFSSFFRRQCEREWRGLVHADYAGLRAMLADSGLEGRRAHGSERVTLLA